MANSNLTTYAHSQTAAHRSDEKAITPTEKQFAPPPNFNQPVLPTIAFKNFIWVVS